MTIEAMKLALDALENIDDAMPFPVGKSAIKALEEALAKQEQEQEPVAWISPSGALYRTRYHAVANAEQSLTPLYLHPPQRTEQEPVAFKIYKPTPPRGAIPNVRDAELPWVYDQDPSSGNVASMWVTPVKHTHPPQRTEENT